MPVERTIRTSFSCMKLFILSAGTIALALPVTALAQSPATTTPPAAAAQPKMMFDVASVKENKSKRDRPDSNFPLGPGDVYSPNGGSFTATDFPLVQYIRFAYKVTANQQNALTEHLPKWVTEARFDIQAKSDKHDATKDEMRLMMRSLLAERFNLAIHSETRQMPLYWLVVAKPGKFGPNLQPHPANDTSCSNAPSNPSNSAQTIAGGYPTICGGVVGIPNGTPGRIKLGARNVTPGLIATSMSGQYTGIDRPVLDHTGLTGRFDFTVEFTPELPSGMIPPPNFDTTGSPFLEALTEQLGLKLEPQKGSVDVWIIDHIDHPSAN